MQCKYIHQQQDPRSWCSNLVCWKDRLLRGNSDVLLTVLHGADSMSDAVETVCGRLVQLLTGARLALFRPRSWSEAGRQRQLRYILGAEGTYWMSVRCLEKAHQQRWQYRDHHSPGVLSINKAEELGLRP
jgi:hypothetical protein